MAAAVSLSVAVGPLAVFAVVGVAVGAGAVVPVAVGVVAVWFAGVVAVVGSRRFGGVWRLSLLAGGGLVPSSVWAKKTL